MCPFCVLFPTLEDVNLRSTHVSPRRYSRQPAARCVFLEPTGCRKPAADPFVEVTPSPNLFRETATTLFVRRQATHRNERCLGFQLWCPHHRSEGVWLGAAGRCTTRTSVRQSSCCIHNTAGHQARRSALTPALLLTGSMVSCPITSPAPGSSIISHLPPCMLTRVAKMARSLIVFSEGTRTRWRWRRCI